ncbi:MAG: Asp-tRNA(Asn)/Glu-tRNA(Gln) amidotransferase subunit GatB [Rhodocyclaceae bacterium]|nr:Asp-tRNA(Asn)/Glu-tRNA(Gln) amidotransferase subunit GatB [Rhodocyclaceae bacterium]MCC6879774.1 Asp-tRNA(Asn)/Glu-tRNA(Gln) amidotransferase subunit GatB [Rhodocyclaceae bacterium]MCL4680341.1 Asp-tRNA(Asn)/Glu-tRNA(Gln) amidotransferase subunit GatB [Rhodocyclaceae bacterium]
MSFSDWEIVIGLETHAQLNTASKIFSGASTAFGAAPNTQACAVDIALPGVLPVLNRGAVERAIRFGLAVGGRVAPRSVFARKNYFYPDLPKGYQISQYELPVVSGGGLTIRVSRGDTAEEKFVRLTRAHLEEDAGKSLHEDFHGRSGIDLNRAGTPLLEIVTEPDMRSAEEAVAYAKALHALVRWIDICDGNMQEGSFRCDANVSVRPKGSDQLGTRREIKNLNSFRFLQQAIEYEARWQIDRLEDGGRIDQATVLFDPATGETRAMRSKEEAHDYRYFPDPDLLPLEISAAWIDEVKAVMPELPEAMKSRFERDYGLSAYDAGTLTAARETAAYFGQAVAAAGAGNAKLCANWVMGELAARLNREEMDIAAAPVGPAQLAGLVARLSDGTLSSKMAKEVFDALWGGEGKDVDAIIEARGLKQISDSGALEKIIDEVLAANPKSVEEFRAGKEKAFNALVGQAMKATKGKANPQQVNELLKKKLAG